MQIPLNVKRNIDIINACNISNLDYGKINDKPFFCTCGIGFDALIADYFAKDENRGFLTYAKLVTEKYPNYKQKEYTLILDDNRVIECKPFFVTFANSSQFGYNAEISPKASVQDGLLDVCVLSAIETEESYGYKIIKDMKPYIEMSESTLYTILKRLELAKMLTVKTAEHGGRLRKYYHITDAGLSRIEEFKNEWREVMQMYRFVTKEEAENE